MDGLAQRCLKALTVKGHGQIGSDVETFSEEVASCAVDGFIMVLSFASPTEKQFLLGTIGAFLSKLSCQNLETVAFAPSNLLLSSISDKGMFKSSAA